MIETGILFLSVLIGSCLGQVFLGSGNLSKFLLTFSGAYFLGIAVLEIFPSVYEFHSHSIGLFVLGGLFFQMLVESLSKGAEHGHVHLKQNQNFPVSIFAGLFIHSFFEGMPIMHQHSNSLLWAIFVHNIPVSMVLYGAVSQTNLKLYKKIIFMTAFALAGPMGLLLGDTALAAYHREATAFVAGIFIHIATVILFESTDTHKFKTRKVLTVLLGFAVAYMTILFGHHH
jgi:zinc transporter ZupT